MFHHFTINCIWLVLFLHELKQVLLLVKQFSFINKRFSQADTTHMVLHFSIQLFANGGMVKAFKSGNKVIHLATCATQI